MFKKFIEQIINSTGREDAVKHIFYGPEGIDMAYQRGKITFKESELLLALINKMAE